MPHPIKPSPLWLEICSSRRSWELSRFLYMLQSSGTWLGRRQGRCTMCGMYLWSCPRASRIFLIQAVLSSDQPSDTADILESYPKIFLKPWKSSSNEVRVHANLTARDLRTTTGKNLKLVKERSGLDPWTANFAQFKVTIWKTNYQKWQQKTNRG